MTTGEGLRRDSTRELSVTAGLSLFAMLAFYFSTNATLHDMDYTSRIASALLRGELGLRETPPDWLNEMIPQGGRYYSAFPLGAVLSMVPVALLQKTELIHDFPGRALAAAIAGLCVHFFSICPPSKADHWRGGFYWRCFQFLELGRGVTSDSAAPGKSLSASLC